MGQGKQRHLPYDRMRMRPTTIYFDFIGFCHRNLIIFCTLRFQIGKYI